MIPQEGITSNPSPISTIVPGGPTVPGLGRKGSQGGRDFAVGPEMQPGVTELGTKTIPSVATQPTSAAAVQKHKVTVEAKPLRESVFAVSNIIIRLFKAIQYYFANKNVFQPSLKTTVSKFFEGASNKEKLESIWYRSENHIQQFVDKTYAKLNEGMKYDLFTREEILKATKNAFEKEFISNYYSYTGVTLNRSQVDVYRNNKCVRDSVTAFEGLKEKQDDWLAPPVGKEKVEWSYPELLDDIKTTEEFITGLQRDIDSNKINLKGYEGTLSKTDTAEKESIEKEQKAFEALLLEKQTELAEMLKHKESYLHENTKWVEAARSSYMKTVDVIPSIDMPVNELGKIPVTPDSKPLLVNTWKRLLEDLRVRGNLDHLEKDLKKASPEIAVMQVKFADQYIWTLQCIPEALKNDLEETIKKSVVIKSQVEKFIWEQPNTLGLRSVPESDEEARRQHIFNELVEPILYIHLNKLLKEDEAKDALKFAEILRDREHEYFVNVSNEILNNLALHSVSKKEMTDLKLTRDDIVDKLVAEVERYAMSDYHLSGEQITKLKTMREEVQKHRNATISSGTIVTKMKEYLNTFTTKMNQVTEKLNQEISKSASKVKIPDLEASLKDLTKEEVADILAQNKGRIEELRAKFTSSDAKESSKIQSALDMVEPQTKQLQNMLDHWQSRSNYFLPDETILIKEYTTDIIKNPLTPFQIKRIEKEIAAMQIKIEETQSELSKAKAGKEGKIKERLERLESKIQSFKSLLDAPKLVQAQEKLISDLKSEQETLVKEADKFFNESLKDISVNDISFDTLKDLPLQALTRKFVLHVWNDILSRLHEINKKDVGTDQDKDDIKLGKLQYLKGKAAARNISDVSLQQSVNEHIEKIEKNPMPFDPIVNMLKEVNDSHTKLQAGIAEVKNQRPVAMQSIPKLVLNISKDSDANTIKLFLQMKQAERKEMEDTLKVAESRFSNLGNLDAEFEAIQKEKKATNLEEVKSLLLKNIKKELTTTEQKKAKSLIDANRILKKKITVSKRELEAKESKIKDMDALIKTLEEALKTGNFSTLSDINETVTIPEGVRDVTLLGSTEITAINGILSNLDTDIKALDTMGPKERKKKESSLLRQQKELNTVLESIQTIKELNGKIESLEKTAKTQIVDKKGQIQKQIESLQPSLAMLRKLVAIEVNAFNAEIVLNMWQKVVEDAFVKGNLALFKNFAKELKDKDLALIVKGMKDLNLDFFLEVTKAADQLPDFFKGQVKDLIDAKLKDIQLDIKQLNSAQETREENSIEEAQLVPELTADVLIGTVDAQDLLPPRKKDLDNLTPYEIDHLKILTKALSYGSKDMKPKLTPKEQEHLKWFVDSLQANNEFSKTFNKKLRDIFGGKQATGTQTLKQMAGMGIHLKKAQKVPFGISTDAVQFTIDLTFNLKDRMKFGQLTAKLENLFNKVDTNQAISKEEKLTLAELGILHKCAKLAKGAQSVIKNLEKLGLLEGNKSLKEVQELAKKADKLLKRADEEFVKQSKYKDGDFLVHGGQKELTYKGKKANMQEELHMRLITPYTHAAKVFIKKEGSPGTQEKSSPVLSHVQGSYMHSDLLFEEGCYSELYRLDVSALIPTSMQTLFTKMYGSNWKDVVQKKYETIENVIQKDETGKFKNFDNPWDRRMEAGKADYIWGGHLNKKERDFEKFVDKFLTDDETEIEHQKTMICSEFATKSTIAALVLLNRQLAKEASDFLTKDPDTKAQGEKLKTQKSVFDLPYDKKLKLKTVHPGRMIDLLKKKNCLHKLPPPPIVQQLIRTE